jgi:drug/metabolite transporter (DMT)-like permease
MSSLFLAQVLALFSALGFATADTATRFGMRTSTPLTATLTLAAVTLLLFGPIALASLDAEEVQVRGVLVFLAAGMASPGLASTFFYLSYRRIGLSRSSILVSSAPLFTVIVAVAALGERPSSLVYLGTIFIVAGVMLLAAEQGSAPRAERRGARLWRDFIFAALATFAFAVSAVLRKVGVGVLPTLSVALCVSAVGCLTAVALLTPFFAPGDRIRFTRQSIGYLLAAGLCASLGHLAFFAGLKKGALSVVAPLSNTTPLFVLAFSWFLLREAEGLTLRVLLGAILICGGAAMVTLSRA